MKRRILSLWLLLCCTFIGHQALAQQTWTPQTLEDGASYYILNKATNLFVSQDVTLAEGSPLAFTATVTENTCKLQNKYGKFASIEIEANSGTWGKATPKSTSASFDGEETELTFTGSAEEGYKFSKTESWKYGVLDRNSASYTGYLTVGDGAFACTNNASDENCIWVLVSVSEYNASPIARQDALARLDKAIAHADEAKKMEGMTTAGRTAIGTQQALAKGTKTAATSSISAIANRVSVDDINKATEDLENKIAEYEAIADYYQACIQEIEEAEAMGGAVPAACTVAKKALQGATSIKVMDAEMSTLRTTCTARLATGDGLGGFDDNVNFTGLIGNNSFDRGNMSCWYTLDIDESKVAGSLLEIIKNAVSKDAAGAAGGLAGIAEAISLGKFSENSHPVVNADYYAMKNGHNRYYYYTHDKGQMIFQPIIGLPAGAYRASALMNAKRYSLFGIAASTCQLSVITIPTSILGDVIKGIDLGAIIKGETGDVLKGILANLGQVIGKGGIKNGSAAPKNGEFVDVNCDFEIEETSIVLIVLNGGTTPLVNVAGEDWFKADNVRLTHIKSLKRAEKELDEALKAEIPTANIADKASDAAPFTYNKKQVDNLQKAYDNAKAVKESGSKSALKIAEAAKKLADTKDAFFDNAFQGPTSAGRFNLTMKDETLDINDKAVTFTSAGEGYNMKFTDAAGSTNFHQVVAFEKAGEAVNTYNVSITDKDGNKVYLSGTTTIGTTDNKENATVFTVVPSYTVETVAAISNGKNTLGTSGNNIILAGVSGNNAHTSLSVTPAAKHEVALNISSLGYGTFILPYSASIPKGFTAYKATGVSADNEVLLEKATKFDACVPYIVYYNGGNKTTLSGIALATENLYTDELLTGAFTLTDVPAGEGNYLLQNQESKGLGFYRVADDGLKIGANRAYLTYGGAAQSVKLLIPSEDATAIETIDSEAGENVIYDLSGRRVNNAVKGVYIINGKKVIK